MFDHDELTREFYLMSGNPPPPKRADSTADLAVWFARFARAARACRLIGCDEAK